MENPSDKQMLRDANGDLIPQYWDITAGDFKPLTGSDGAQDTRLTGSMVKERNLVSGVVVTDTTPFSLWGASVGDISDFGKNKYLHIRNTHDQDMAVSIIYAYLRVVSSNFFRQSLDDLIIPANSSYMLTGDIAPVLKEPLYRISMQAKFDFAPTKGSVSVWILGEGR